MTPCKHDATLAQSTRLPSGGNGENTTKNTASDATVAVRFEARIWREACDTTRVERDPVTREWREAPVHYEASWAVYDVESCVRMDYSTDEAAARRTVERWNAGKIPDAMQNKAKSARDLRKLLKPGDTVFTLVRNVSRSGMKRRISLFVPKDGEIVDITWDVARAMGDSVKQGGKYVQDAGMVVNGCGMDMCFHTVYNLSRTLFPDGFKVDGRGRNGDTSGWDTDGGYALKNRGL